jgi:predicted DNA-binding transcriptional regulator AlpA
VTRELRYCNDTYRRDADGVWRYPWDAPVPGAVDLTLADVLGLQVGSPDDAMAGRRLTDSEFRWATGRAGSPEGVIVRQPANRRPDARDIVVGMFAPELHVSALFTVAQIAKAAGVSKATIDSYRYRGYLPEPQTMSGRTPLWARPIINRWLETRPGAGWRSDIYGRQQLHERAVLDD